MEITKIYEEAKQLLILLEGWSKEGSVTQSERDAMLSKLADIQKGVISAQVSQEQQPQVQSEVRYYQAPTAQSAQPFTPSTPPPATYVDEGLSYDEQESVEDLARGQNQGYVDDSIYDTIGGAPTQNQSREAILSLYEDDIYSQPTPAPAPIPTPQPAVEREVYPQNSDYSLADFVAPSQQTMQEPTPEVELQQPQNFDNSNPFAGALNEEQSQPSNPFAGALNEEQSQPSNPFAGALNDEDFGEYEEFESAMNYDLEQTPQPQRGASQAKDPIDQILESIRSRPSVSDMLQHQVVADTYAEQSADSVSERLAGQIYNLSRDVGINDRYVIARALFEGDVHPLMHLFHQLDMLNSFDEAAIYLSENYGFDNENSGVQLLMALLKRRFSAIK